VEPDFLYHKVLHYFLEIQDEVMDFDETPTEQFGESDEVVMILIEPRKSEERVSFEPPPVLGTFPVSLERDRELSNRMWH
jgi:hypothetical protein